MAYAVRSRSSCVFGPNVWRGPRSVRAIALTFDDGPTPSTRRLLEILAREGVPATFFVCGKNAERYPEIVREAVAAGHEIGNHTYTHPMLFAKAKEFIRDEIERTQKLLQREIGVTPVLFRAPFGVRTWGMGGIQKELGLLGVMWTVIGRDWKAGSREVHDRIMKRAGNGAIVCLHDGRGLDPNPNIRNTLSAVRALIPRLRAQGYSFQTVSSLLCKTR
jgi:peptidoglycan/xylan/chitin deacetylase (PgdA/CDA1 family)